MSIVPMRRENSPVTNDKDEPLGRALLAAIRRELGDVDFFSREDLLQLGAFDHVTTISRYRYVCWAVRWLLRAGLLVGKSRTDLCLPGKAKLYAGGAGMLETYMDTIREHVRSQSKIRPFTVGTILDRWRTDQHLTRNTKRVLVRQALTALNAAGVVTRLEDNAYQLER